MVLFARSKRLRFLSLPLVHGMTAKFIWNQKAIFPVQISVVSRGVCDEQYHLLTRHGNLGIIGIIGL
jgi:hypothetical protein